MNVKEIPLERIFITKNVRFDTDEELGELIESTGHMLLQPIGVYPRGARYELVWGHRRYRAAQANNEPTIAAHVLENISEHDIPLIKLQENMVRKQLTTEEIIAAADEIKRRRPELTDGQVDRLLGKRHGYLGYHRSILKARSWLVAQGLKEKDLEGMTTDELSDFRAKLEEKRKGKANKKRNRDFPQRGHVPETGFEIVCAKGPNILVVCASGGVKSWVLRALRELAKKTA